MSSSPMREMTPDELEAAGLPRDFHSRPVQPPPSETKLRELKKLLDGYAVIAYRNGFRSRTPGSECIDISAARSSLESLYRELLDKDAESQRRLQMADELIAVQNHDRYRLDVQIEGLQSELSALRSLQLTEDERQFITDGLLLHAPGWRIPDVLSEKLRISSKATSEEL